MKSNTTLPEDDKIGCAVIKEMRRDVADMKKNKLPIPWIAWLFCILGFVIVAGFVVRTFRPPRLPERVVYEVKLDKANNPDGKIDEATIKKELAEALIAVEARAANEYNDKFITLLTVLALFGIAWPLIVAFAQYKFNERELNKIQDTDKKASDALDNANKASDNAQNALTNATEATNNATTALTKASKAADDATSAFANANKAVGDATSALTNANKALEENRQTNDIVQSIFESFTKNNYLNWKAQAVFYKNLEFVIKRTKIGNLAIYNMLKIMSLHCTCVGIGMGHLNVVNADDVKNITNAVLHISPEASPDKCSILSKTVIAFVKEAIETFLKFNQDSKIKQQLSEFLQKITDIHEAYKQLAPENEEEDSKA